VKNPFSCVLPLLSIAALALSCPAAPVAAAGLYDPLALAAGKAAAPGVDFTVHDGARNCDLPVRVFLPTDSTAAPVILFSPGLGGSREGSAYLGEHWAGRGYVAVYLQHPGSDDSVWKGLPRAEMMPAMKAAASLENFRLRVKDVVAVLDQLTVWNTQAGHALHGRLDLGKVGMSGHSFGAVTTEAVSGEALASFGPVYTDARIKAALAFSPSVPQRGDPATAFGTVKIPWMLMTGTKDASPISDADPASRLKIYPYLHAAPKYQVVLNNAEHSAFTDRALPGDSEPRNPNHHRVILALSTAFWDAYLRGDKSAAEWLAGPGPRGVMQPEDQWQFAAGSE
jgi:predicted dienelactone hydrolase